jgi:hypothetical protein
MEQPNKELFSLQKPTNSQNNSKAPPLQLAKIIMALSVEAIKRGLKKLPQELYNEVYIFVFTAPRGPIDLTNRSNPVIHTALKFLSISSDSRAIYAASYYSREFTLRENWFMHSITPVIEWVDSVPQAYRHVFTKLTLIRNNNNGLSSNEYLASIVGSCRRDIVAVLGTEIADKVVYELAGGPLR